MNADLAPLLQEFARMVAREIVALQREEPPEMIDQHASPLGPRRHCAAVKRRLAKGLPDASIVGRKHLLTPEALQQELGRGVPQKVRTAPAKSGPVNTLASELDALVANAG